MKRDEMVLNGTSLSVCLSVCVCMCQRMVVLRSRRDAGWMDSFWMEGGRKE